MMIWCSLLQHSKFTICCCLFLHRIVIVSLIATLVAIRHRHLDCYMFMKKNLFNEIFQLLFFIYSFLILFVCFQYVFQSTTKDKIYAFMFIVFYYSVSYVMNCIYFLDTISNNFLYYFNWKVFFFLRWDFWLGLLYFIYVGVQFLVIF